MSELYEDIASAFDEAQKLDTPEVSQDTGGDKARDDSGRFTSDKASDDVKAAVEESTEKKEAPVAEKAAAEPKPDEDPKWTQDKPPQSWTPKARERWAEIPPELRQEIVRREEASVHGVRQMQERYAPMESFVRSIDPIIQEARNVGMSPEQYIGAAVQSEYILRTADVPNKFQEILRIADQYGIPLREVINASVGQEVLGRAAPQNAAAIPQAVQQELAEMRAWREGQERTSIDREVETFSTGKEFFNDVRGKMADLMEKGLADNLNDAYDQACWMTPEVREVMQGRATGQQQQQQLAGRQAAAAAASIAPTGKVRVAGKGDDDEDDMAETIRKAWSAAEGRV